ncbi:hypothetical protein L596_026979 [Steinernema carpocapsae]|uniref:Uncharacterized protein n=1 Tax=Steinernema carpocapsae TaxID=34508 RepID=A0A4U5M2Y7_STECR|nr:hypothetical protein L596_026979 [Steinernema carpocapsae]
MWRALRFLCCTLINLIILIVVVFFLVIFGEKVFMWMKVEKRGKEFDQIFAKARLDFEKSNIVGPYGHWVYGIIPGNHTEWYKNDRVFMAEFKYDADEKERRLREGMVIKKITHFVKWNNDSMLEKDMDKLVTVTGMAKEEEKIGAIQPCEETPAISCLPAFKNVNFARMEEYLVAPEESLIACLAPTSFKRHLETMMCYLNDPLEFRKQHKRVRIERERKYGSRLCRSKRRYKSLSGIYDENQSDAFHWNHIMLHENPGERFVNAYIQACIENDNDLKTTVGRMCYECEEDLTCFIERIFARILLIDEGKVIPDESEYPFLPQTWFCRLNENFGLYSVFQLPLSNNAKANMTEKINDFLQLKGVSAFDAEIAADSFYWKLRKYQTKSEEVPVEVDSQKFYMTQLSVSHYMLRFLVKMYYYDYVYFKMSVPWYT